MKTATSGPRTLFVNESRTTTTNASCICNWAFMELSVLVSITTAEAAIMLFLVTAFAIFANQGAFCMFFCIITQFLFITEFTEANSDIGTAFRHIS